MAHYIIHFHMCNRGITHLNKPFQQTTTTCEEINEPYLPLIINRGGDCFYKASRSFHLAGWQGVVANSASRLFAPQLLPANKEARLSVLVRGARRAMHFGRLTTARLTTRQGDTPKL